MKFLYKILPAFLLCLAGCSSSLTPRASVTAVFKLEVTGEAGKEKVREILLTRLQNIGFDKEDIKVKTAEEILELSLADYDSIEIPLEELRKLLTADGILEFWKTYEGSAAISFFGQIDTALSRILPFEKINGAPVNSVAGDTSFIERLAVADQMQIEKNQREHPLFTLLAPSVNAQGLMWPGPVIGRSHIHDTSQVMDYLQLKEARQILPKDMVLRWFQASKQDTLAYLIALMKEGDSASMRGQFISDAEIQFENSGRSCILLSMEGMAAERWARLTADNVGRSIAIVFDGRIFSYPTVQSKIIGGKSQITGDFTLKEARTMASILNAGLLQNSVRIAGLEILTKE